MGSVVNRLSERISEYSINPEAVFEGPYDINGLVQSIQLRESEKQKIMAKAKAAGRKEREEEITKKILEAVELYVKINAFVAYTVNQRVKKENLHLNITDVRAKLYPLTKEIELMFLIKCGFEEEEKFCNMLCDLTKELFKNDDLYADLFFLNQEDSEIDHATLKSDYPYLLKSFTEAA